MKTCMPCIFAIVISLVLSALSPAQADNSYSNSYFGRLMPEGTYRIFKDSLRQRVRHETDLDGVRARGEEFFDHLATHNHPDFSSFAAGDVNIDPVGVIWSQFELAMQGATNELRVPEDYRKLHLAVTTWNAWNAQPGSEFTPELRCRMYFDAYRRLKASGFLVATADSRAYSIFLSSLFTPLGKQIEAGDPAAKNFLADWSQAKLDISRWDWDPELQEALIKQHATPDYYFPALLTFSPTLMAMQKQIEQGQPDQYEWFLHGLIDRFRQVGSRIGTALLICDPLGNATPSKMMIELIKQGKPKTIYLQDPFPWIGVADYLLWSAEFLAPAAHPETDANEFHVNTESLDPDATGETLKPSIEALPAAAPSGKGAVAHAIAIQPDRTPAKRRSLSGLRDLGFPVTISPTVMTEEERAAFCASWQKEAKQVLAQFDYMLNILSRLRQSDPDYLSQLWISRIGGDKAGE